MSETKCLQGHLRKYLSLFDFREIELPPHLFYSTRVVELELELLNNSLQIGMGMF